MAKEGSAGFDGADRDADRIDSRPRWQPRREWIMGTLAALAIIAAAALHGLTSNRTPALAGTALTPPRPAYDFRLRDQDGRDLSLSELRGKAVVLTFLYVHCPDYCPVIADKLRQTDEELGPERQHVAFLAVSVDPRGDTPAAVRGFLLTHRVQGELEYLTGSAVQLRPIWEHYWVAGVAAPSSIAVTHTTVVYVIDPSGAMRVFFGWQFAPHELANDLRILTGHIRDRAIRARTAGSEERQE
ncbi:MAG TPA: SCO family protein [bacterium]|nr:SCO family protein [bacterium]